MNREATGLSFESLCNYQETCCAESAVSNVTDWEKKKKRVVRSKDRVKVRQGKKKLVLLRQFFFLKCCHLGKVFFFQSHSTGWS